MINDTSHFTLHISLHRNEFDNFSIDRRIKGKIDRKTFLNSALLKRHGDVNTSELDKIEFLGGFCKFCSVFENMKFHKITSFIK